IFEVYSTDQTEARALLDPSLMERLTALEALFKQPSADESPPPVVAVFADGAFLVAAPFSAGAPLQEIRGRGALARLDAYVADQLLAEIDVALGVVDAVTGGPAREAV